MLICFKQQESIYPKLKLWFRLKVDKKTDTQRGHFRIYRSTSTTNCSVFHQFDIPLVLSIFDRNVPVCTFLHFSCLQTLNGKMTIGWITLDVGEQVRLECILWRTIRPVKMLLKVGAYCNQFDKNMDILQCNWNRSFSLQALVYNHDGRARIENGPNRVSSCLWNSFSGLHLPA